ncbi:MAG: HEPN domain-containing protein [Chthoniobacterales bacterium]
MSPESVELAQAWLKKAFSDLAAARLLIRGNERHLAIGAYHCQQVAEKALKAYLTARETIFPQTHVLEHLLEFCLSSNSEFQRFRRHTKELTPLADEFRYPGDAAEPTLEEAQGSLQMAEEVYAFCEVQLSRL